MHLVSALFPPAKMSLLEGIASFLPTEELPRLLVWGREFSAHSLPFAPKVVRLVQGRWEELLTLLKKDHEHPEGEGLLKRVAAAIDDPHSLERHFELRLFFHTCERGSGLAPFSAIALRAARVKNPPLFSTLIKEGWGSAPFPWFPPQLLKERYPSFAKEWLESEEPFDIKGCFERFASLYSPSDPVWEEILLHLLEGAEKDREDSHFVTAIQWMWEAQAKVAHRFAERIVVVFTRWNEKFRPKQKGPPESSWHKALRHPLFEPKVLPLVFSFLKIEEISLAYPICRALIEKRRGDAAKEILEEMKAKMRAHLALIFDPDLRLGKWAGFVERVEPLIKRASVEDRWYLKHLARVALEGWNEEESSILCVFCSRMLHFRQFSLFTEFLKDPLVKTALCRMPQPLLIALLGQGPIPFLIKALEQHQCLSPSIVEALLYLHLSKWKPEGGEELVRIASSIQHPSLLLETLLFFEAVLSPRPEKVASLVHLGGIPAEAVTLGTNAAALGGYHEIHGRFFCDYLKRAFNLP